MRQWADLHRRFTDALLDPAVGSPPEVLGSEAGFAVYRNNVMSSLVDALADRFPVTHALVGTEFFRAMGRLFVREHLPSSRLMMFYGEELPDFIASFGPASSVPYLADVAKLEAAWSRAYHAADAKSLGTAALGAFDSRSLASSSLRLHPSLHLIRSRYPIATLWDAHQSGTSGGVDLEAAENVLIVRADAEVLMHRLTPEAFAFVDSLHRGQCIEQAADAALAESQEFDAGAHLVSLFSIGAIIAIAPPAEES